MRHHTLLCCVLGLTVTFPATGSDDRFRHIPVSTESVEPGGNHRSLSKEFFIENRGQWNSAVRLLLTTPGLDLWVADRSITYDLHRSHHADSTSHRRGHVVRMVFESALADATAGGNEQLPGRYNYFRGPDPNRWATNVPLYRSARIERLYDGIDARLYIDRGAPRYDLLVAPGADPSQVMLLFDGAGDVMATSTGALEIVTGIGTLRQDELFAYQDIDGCRQRVDCRFVVLGKRVRFEIGAYDRGRQLVIDPLIYSTLAGGSGDDVARGIAVDESGHAYITGATWDDPVDYPTTPGAYDQTHNMGRYDLFVTKLSPTGTSLVYSTFIGGTGVDEGYAIAVDGDGNAYVTGTTQIGSNYPTTNGAYSTVNRGQMDVCVTKLNATGSTLLYSTLIGGTSFDYGYAIAVDGAGNAYVTGSTQASGNTASDYPTTSGAYARTHRGVTDLFVSKIDPTGSTLLYSTLIGGTGTDEGYGIGLDEQGVAYVAGYTESADYPTRETSFGRTYRGSGDAIVTAVNTNGTALVYSSYLGGDNVDRAHAVAVDAAGHAYVGGRTINGTIPANFFPTTVGAYDQTPNGNADVFVTKMSTDGSSLVYSTLIGGSAGDFGHGIALNGTGEAYVTGRSDSAGAPFPTTAGAYSSAYRSVADIFVVRLNATGSGLVHSTLIGGGASDIANAIAVDRNGDPYVAGTTGSATTDYPTTPGAFDATHNGTNDVFVTKLGGTGMPNISVGSGRSLDAITFTPIAPNPASRELMIGFALPKSRVVSIEIHDAAGRHVATPRVARRYGAGEHIERIDVGELSSGRYLVRVLSEEIVHDEWILVVR